MPFKSKAQQRFMFAAEARGELPKGKALEWAHETKNIKALPEHKKMDKTAEQIVDDLICKFAAVEEHESHPVRGVLGALGGGVLGGLATGVAAQSLPVGAKAEIHELAHPNKGVQSMMNNPAYPHLKNMNAKQRVSFRRGGIGGAIGGAAGLLAGGYLGF